METHERERRAFVRIRCPLSVSYKFIVTHPQDKILQKEYRGISTNISTNGLLLVGKMPKPEWIGELLAHKIALAVSIKLPADRKPIKAVARVAWLDAVLSDKVQEFEMGLFFKELTNQDRDKLLKFILDKVV